MSTAFAVGIGAHDVGSCGWSCAYNGMVCIGMVCGVILCDAASVTVCGDRLCDDVLCGVVW